MIDGQMVTITLSTVLRTEGTLRNLYDIAECIGKMYNMEYRMVYQNISEYQHKTEGCYIYTKPQEGPRD